MSYTYKIRNIGLNKQILRSYGTSIPENENNIDYQVYSKWLDGYTQQFNSETHELEWVLTTPGGNTPESTDE